MPVELPSDFFKPRDGPTTSRDESPTAEIYRPRWITREVANALRHDQVPEDEIPRRVPPHQHLRFDSFTSCYYEKPKSARLVLSDGCAWFHLIEVCALQTKVYWVQAGKDVLVDHYAGEPSRHDVWVRACPDNTITFETPNSARHPDTSMVPIECVGSAYAHSAAGGNVVGREYVWVLRPPLVLVDECHAVATYVLHFRDTVTAGPAAATSKSELKLAEPEQTAVAIFYICSEQNHELQQPQVPLKEEQSERRPTLGAQTE